MSWPLRRVVFVAVPETGSSIFERQREKERERESPQKAAYIGTDEILVLLARSGSHGVASSKHEQPADQILAPLIWFLFRSRRQVQCQGSMCRTARRIARSRLSLTY